MKLDDSVTQLKGVGAKKAEALARLNIYSIEDMLFFMPRDYEDRRNPVKIRNIEDGMTAVIEAEVMLIVKNEYRYRGKQLLKLLISDDTGKLEVVFFNARYVQNSFKNGNRYVFYGKITERAGRFQMLHPEFDAADESSLGILPVYPLTKGVSQREIRKWQRALQPEYGNVEEFLPQNVIDDHRLCSLSYALANVHFPQEKQRLLEARYRLIFDELLILQTGIIAAGRKAKEGEDGIAFSEDVNIDEYIKTLPYPLTEAQQRCVGEIEADMESRKVMNRLVQGDVGSGKTVLAEIAMYKCVRSGYQSALMAPTEILAKQHFEHFSRSFQTHGIKVGFLSGSMKAAEKKETLEQIRSGEIQIIIGTNAVIQTNVIFNDLGLVITDEQHRFGVRQRVKLKEKGNNPDVLVMTATPIPRTLAVVLYGDLDISVIDQLPPGRKAITTRTLGADKRDKCYDFLEEQIRCGRQAYVVAPLIEESDVMDIRSAQQVYEELSRNFKEYDVALIHGAMKQDEKDGIMERFYTGDIDVLVATVVIEVGINVPNATVMVIENAERFGLAQLHQLRGRIGRGSEKSYCFLISEGDSEIARKRGEIMENSSDGFVIAEEDLNLRGPGEIFGTRQHGLPDLKVADLAKNVKILNEARGEAQRIVEEDPMLTSENNKGLRHRVSELFGEEFTDEFTMEL